MSKNLSSWTRRSVLGSSATLVTWAYAPRFSHAAQSHDPRLVTIILRGALDGLSALAPIGDPNYADLRKQISLTKDGQDAALMLDPFFGLHPSMPQFARLYAKGEALALHAIATPYRDRSHFDGQDMLESGMPAPGLVESGWLNRVLEALPKGERISSHSGLAIGPTAPLIMRGRAPILGWSPPAFQRADEHLVDRVLHLYRKRDPRLAIAFENGLAADRIVGRESAYGRSGNVADQMKAMALGTARLMAAPDGPRIAALAFDGWDTHSQEGGATGSLSRLLAGLDFAFTAFEEALGSSWQKTVILVATEFGRTAAINGTAGTDHGTGTVALLAGGAVKGGRIISDWPGLKTSDLYQGRDLKPTLSLHAAIKGILNEHLGLSQKILSSKIFPATEMLSPIRGLIA